MLGSANMDLVVRQHRAVRPGETIFGTGFRTGPGGKGLNQAVAAARAGAQVHFIGAVGGDDFGGRLREFARAQGIDTARLRTDARATGIAAITVTDDAENSIVVVPGANAVDELDDDDRRAIAESSHLVIQLERPLPLIREALRVARQHGVVTVLTPAPVTAECASLLDLVDILVPNEQEAVALSGAADGADAAARLSEHAETVIVTLGGDGVAMARAGSVVEVLSAHPVTPVDTTGAGDTFVGVLVAFLADGAPWDRALTAAITGAAIAVTREGAAESLPTRAEIEAVLARS